MVRTRFREARDIEMEPDMIALIHQRDMGHGQPRGREKEWEASPIRG